MNSSLFNIVSISQVHSCKHLRKHPLLQVLTNEKAGTYLKCSIRALLFKNTLGQVAGQALILNDSHWIDIEINI